jgi:predicted Zn-dependent protease
MRTSFFTIVIAAGLVLAVSSGCSKQEEEETTPVTTSESTAPSTSQADAELKQAGAELKQAADDATQQAKDVAGSVSQTATQAAADLKPATNEATEQANNLFAQAKSFMAEKKYSEALNSLKQLSNLKLTPEQQKMLDDLKQQVQAALAKAGATEAASKLGDVLGGKK